MDTSYEKRLQRTLDAVAMKPVDKIPYSYSGAAYVACNQGITTKEFITDEAAAASASIGFCKDHPGIDSIHSPIFNPHALSTLWLSKVKEPGKELDDDEQWQVYDEELITFDDYQKIIDMGYGPWVNQFMKEKLDDPVSKLGNFAAYTPVAFQRLKDEAGVPVVNGAMAVTPIEGFCGGRRLENFFIDIMDDPELVKKAFDKAHEYLLENYKNTIAALKPIGAWVGGWHAAPELMNHDMWMEFVWPYFLDLVNASVEYGVVPILHFDSNWDSGIETLKELPAQKCLLMLDGKTDMRRARSILGDHMAMMGDVHPFLLAFGTADEVYDYTKKLIDDVGPKTGLIISSGCDNPLNAKPENVDAMVQATIDYAV